MTENPSAVVRSQRHYVAAGAVLFLALFFNNAPTPLYPLWQAQYGLGTAATTAIHSAYPIGTIIGLLFGGKLADQLGRKVILLAAAGFGIAGAVMVLSFDTFLPLLTGRLMNGIATGLFSGPITAAMIELEPKADHARASWSAALMTTVSAAVGTFAATLIVDRAPSIDAALTWPFLIQAGLYLVAILVIARIPETLPLAWRKSWRQVDFVPRKVRVPTNMRREFRIAACAAFAVWAMIGLWLGLGSALAVAVLGREAIFHGGAAASVMLASAGAIQIAAPKLDDRWSIKAGMCLTLISLVAIAGFITSGWTHILYLATVLAGGGQGLAWLGCMRLVNRLAPADQRAETVSALYIVVYAGVASVFLIGLVASATGLIPAVEMFLLAIGALGIFTLTIGRR